MLAMLALVNKGEIAMPVYQDKNTKKYYFTCYYSTWQGERKRKVKRGFELARDAKDAEREFLSQYKNNADITFSALYDIYINDCKARLKPSTIGSKLFIYNTNIKPYFNKQIISEITPAQVRKWQNIILAQYSPTTAKQYHGQLSAVFNFACKFYGLPKNPANIAGSIGASKADSVKYWTLEQFNKFIEYPMPLRYKAIYTVLFFSGLRIGELLALTLADYNADAATISVNKTLVYVKGKYILQTPKTKKSVRKLTLPKRATSVLDEYINTLYEPKKSDVIFFIRRHTLLMKLKRVAEKIGLPIIRVHDLRHSHASLLINNNVNIKAISERLGHEDINTTLNTYSHIYATQHSNIADLLDKL